jgi:hypothetical protein
MSIEGEGLQDKGMCNIFNKIITQNCPNLKKELPIQVEEFSSTTNSLDQNKTYPWHIIIITKAQRTEKEYWRL